MCTQQKQFQEKHFPLVVLSALQEIIYIISIINFYFSFFYIYLIILIIYILQIQQFIIYLTNYLIIFLTVLSFAI